MKRTALYPVLLPGLVPFMLFTGGVESPLRFIYYPVLLIFTPLFGSNAIFQSSLAFSLFFCLMPLVQGVVYPAYEVAVNVSGFMVMAITAGYLSDRLRQDSNLTRRASDTYHGLTNALNLQISNLHSQIDSISEAHDRLKEVDANKTRFLAAISHEIRSPLSSIRSFSEILQNYDDIDEETKKEFYSIINEESERLTQLTNDILDAVRVESGKTVWHMERVDLGEAISMAVKTILPLAKSKGVSCEAKVPVGLSEVSGDKNRLVQVLLNLLSNAVKFTSQGSIIAGAEETPEEIRLYVSDTGEGIYPEEKDKIFEEFYRIGDDLAGRPKGAGLGLSISKKIIQAHGGRLWVESELGSGSTFFFTLPKKEEEIGLAPRAPHYAEIREGKLLILENDTVLRQILREDLDALGYSTVAAVDEKTTVEMAKARRPDAIIIGYPESEESFGELRALFRTKGVPLYLVSIINEEKKGSQVAVNGYISTPLSKVEVEAVLKKVFPRDRGSLYIISEDSDEARGLQLLAGEKGHTTTIVSSVSFIDATKPSPDVIIIGTLSKEEVYRTIRVLRNDKLTRDVPIILKLNILIRDIECISLGSSEYGSGLHMLTEIFRRRV